MPTTKQRINITLEDELFLILKSIADKAKQSLSSISVELIKKSLEREEDIYFSDLADKRLSSDQKRIPHSKAWK
jgi:predicted DNA-binding protein